MEHVQRLEPAARARRLHTRLPVVMASTVLLIAAVVAIEAAVAVLRLPSPNSGDASALPVLRFFVGTMLWAGGLVTLCLVVRTRRRAYVPMLLGATMMVGVVGGVGAYDIVRSATNAPGQSHVFALGFFGSVAGGLLVVSALIGMGIHLRAGYHMQGNP